MKRLQEVPLHFRLLGLVGLMVAGFLAMTAGLLHIQNQRAIEAREAALRALVREAKVTAANLFKDEEAGRIAHRAALDSFRTALRGMRHGSGDYLFACTMDGTVVAMPSQPDMEGQNRYAIHGPIGGGAVQTLAPRPGTAEPVPEPNYTEPFEPWNMLIAGGVFIDSPQADDWSLLLRTTSGAATAIGLAAALAWLLGRSVSRPFPALDREIAAPEASEAIAAAAQVRAA